MLSLKVRVAQSLVKSNLEDPSVTYPPAGINRSALPIWQKTLHQFSEVVFSGSTLMNWQAAITLFESLCKIEGVEPWEHGKLV